MNVVFRTILCSCILLASLNCEAQQDVVLNKDTAVVKKDTVSKPKLKDSLLRQLRIGFDIATPIKNAVYKTRNVFELEADYFLKNETYIVAEGGWGSSDYNYPDLSYTTHNVFLRAGIDKSLLSRMTKKDWDIFFLGLRYGIGFINRGEATYLIVDSLWGNITGTIPAQNNIAHWGEITGGMRLEVVKGFFIGWTVRGKFLFNGGSFKELPPAYIAGYGKGDRSTMFDYNFFLCYALRWK